MAAPRIKAEKANHSLRFARTNSEPEDDMKSFSLRGLFSLRENTICSLAIAHGMKVGISTLRESDGSQSERRVKSKAERLP